MGSVSRDLPVREDELSDTRNENFGAVLLAKIYAFHRAEAVRHCPSRVAETLTIIGI